MKKDNLKIKNYLNLSSLFISFVIIGSGIITTSCEKEDTVIQNDQQGYLVDSDKNIIVTEGRLVFKTIKDYELTIEELANMGDDNFEYWESNIGFCSMRSYFTEDELEEKGIVDPLFACLINSEGIVQIENYIYKIDIPNSKVQVCDFKQYSTTIDFSKKGSLEFSTDDNVLYILNGIEEENTEKGYCASQNTGWYTWNCPAGSVQYRNRYFKAGIYYSLVARVEPSGNGVTGAISTNENECYWTNSKGTYDFEGETSEQTSNHNLRPYSGTRRLSEFYYAAEFLLRDVGHPQHPIGQPYAVINCD